jgi:ATP-dependent helicase/nuclease subunit B
MVRSPLRVFNIPASAPFLPALVDALVVKEVSGFPHLPDPLALAGATLYLPSRRACRLARDVFRERVPGGAAMLPRIVALGDIDEDEIAFAETATGEAALDLPEALGGLTRMMPLAAMILRWADTIAPREQGQAPLVANNPLTAFALAQDLARLMDDIATRQVRWERLDELVPEEFDEYWAITLKFLKFIHAQWPTILAEKGRIDPVERRDRLIAAETARLAKTNGPVIAAGSTGSIPATATLLETIAKLPHGALVLPGLDTDLDEPTWAALTKDTETSHGHPQFALAALLKRIGLTRADVRPLTAAAPHGRELIVSEALRPAAASALWKDRLGTPAFVAQADAAMAGIAVIEAANAEEEALAIAVALREAMEAPDETAALVTPDVGLGRRVKAALARWNVPVDDSRGASLADTPDGVFARLAAEVALGGVAPMPLLALLKHPAGQFDPAAVSALERAVLRGPRPQHGTAGLQAAVALIRDEIARHRAGEASSLHYSDPRLLLTGRELADAAALAAHLRKALAPLEELPRGPHPVAELARRHAEAVGHLGAMTTDLARGFADICDSGALDVTAADYPGLFQAAIGARAIYSAEAGARVRIFGTIESRLQSVDRLVLGGLVEGVWPPETRGDPWLSRTMRHELGLDLPERRIGLSAHDFAQALGAKKVILSRAAKLAGAPTVASRFTQRLAAVAGKERWDAALARGARYIALARTLDETDAPKPVERPAPKPPFEARPRRLSVTEIEDLLRDPYTIYARHVLKLRPLDAIDAPPDAADRGTVIHNAIGEFGKAYPDTLPADPARVLTGIGERLFKPLTAFPEARAFWWPRFQRIAQWLASFEITRRAALTRVDVEVGGKLEIPFGTDAFTLTVRADRIEHLTDGRYAILDYKTGQPPSEPQVRTGLSPQLTLEAAILRRGGFDGIPPDGSVAELLYVRLSGGAEAGEERPITFKEGTPDSHADHALAELIKVLAAFADPAKPYYSLLHPMWSNHYGTYDHLARVQEWSQAGGGREGGGGP